MLHVTLFYQSIDFKDYLLQQYPLFEENANRIRLKEEWIDIPNERDVKILYHFTSLDNALMI